MENIMDKKEFVQRYVLAQEPGSIRNVVEIVEAAIQQWETIEQYFTIKPTTNLWDYNDMKR